MCCKTPRARCFVFQRLVVLVSLSVQAMSPWMEDTTSPVSTVGYFQNCFILTPFLNLSVLLKFNLSINFVYQSLLSVFQPSRFFPPLAPYFLISLVCFSTFTIMCAFYLWFLFSLHWICLSCLKWLFFV
jgi:hypothetical protein